MILKLLIITRYMSKENEIGYVYIFTNDSFRDDWVKIGKTKNIKERLKNLFNTSLPLEFKVYATLQTAKYEAVEKINFDSKAFLSMVLSIVIIVSIIAVFSVINSDKKVVQPKQQVRQGLSDIPCK